MTDGLRRTPKPGRGQRTVDRILAAADEAFAADGYENASTNRIAAAAGVPVGSLYQFFPNKEAVLRALTDRYLDQVRGLHERVLSPLPSGGQVPVVLAALFEEVVRFYDAHPGFRPLFFGSATAGPLAAAAGRLRAELVRCSEDVLAAARPDLAGDERRLMAEVCTEAACAMVAYAVAQPVGRRAAAVREATWLLTGYLGTAPDPSAPAKRCPARTRGS